MQYIDVKLHAPRSTSNPRILTMQAILLAAGKGTRLRAQTGNAPKSMLEFNGSTLIEQCISRLSAAGVDRVIVVVGYEAQQLREHLGDFYEVPIEYVYAHDFATTNNVVSLHVAAEKLVEDDTILVETDLVFSEMLVRRVLEDPRPNVVVVDKYELWMDGSAVRIDPMGRVTGFHSKDVVLEAASDSDFLKTVNIYKFDREFARRCLVPQLAAYLQDAEHHSDYYEQVLDVIARGQLWTLAAHVLDEELWYEIDDGEDLECAKLLFAQVPDRLEGLVSRAGGMWRFPGIKDVSRPSGPDWPPPWLVSEMRWSVDHAMSSPPSSLAVQDALAASALRVNPTRVAVVSTHLLTQLGDVRRIGPDEVVSSGATRLSDFLALVGDEEFLVEIDALYGLSGIDLKVWVTPDESKLASVRAQRTLGLDSMAEYALQVVGKHERRLFGDVQRALEARDSLARGVEETGLFSSVRGDDYGVWVSLRTGDPAQLVESLLREGTFVHDHVGDELRFAIMSEVDLRAFLDTLLRHGNASPEPA